MKWYKGKSNKLYVLTELAETLGKTFLEFLGSWKICIFPIPWMWLLKLLTICLVYCQISAHDIKTVHHMKREKCKQNMRKISQDVVYGFMQKMKCLQNGPSQFNSRTVVVNIMPCFCHQTEITFIKVIERYVFWNEVLFCRPFKK